MAERPRKKAVGRKDYHHGSLREALLDAAHRQICRFGVERLSIAGLCKALKVSNAAPYRHFDDRQALIGEVSARGFRALTDALREARDAHPKGSIEGLIALGQAYVGFVASDPEMFHLMWGTTREKFESEVAFCAGQEAFSVLIECVSEIQRARGLDHLDTVALAMPLWSSVHGLATLRVGERLRVADGLDLDRTVEFNTRAFFAGLENPGAALTAPSTLAPCAAETAFPAEAEAAQAPSTASNPSKTGASR